MKFDEIEATLISEVQAMRRNLMDVDALIAGHLTTLAVDRARQASETLADSTRRLMDELRTAG